MKTPEEYIKDYMLDDLDGHMAFTIQEIQKESYNQAIEDSKKLVNSIALDDASIRHIVNLIEELKIKIMSAYKVASTNCLSGLQIKKNVYKSKSDFDKYSPELIERWSRFRNVSIYTLNENDKWDKINFYSSKCNQDCSGCWLKVNYGCRNH